MEEKEINKTVPRTYQMPKYLLKEFNIHKTMYLNIKEPKYE